MVPTKNVAWQAGNWRVNTHSVASRTRASRSIRPIFTNQLYHSLERLTRYTAERYGIPLDREQIIGHDQVPGSTSAFQAGMHWDPGTFFDWAHFMALLGAPINSSNANGTGRVVTIDPNFQTNHPPVSACDGSGQHALPAQATNFVYLHTAPSSGALLVDDPPLPGPATTCAQDWGDKAVTGQSFAVADRQGEWTVIWYGGQKAWFEDPAGASTAIPGGGTLVTPMCRPRVDSRLRARLSLELVDGDARLHDSRGQNYVAKDLVGADYYSASTFNAPATYSVVTSNGKFYEISFNHRLALVKATDVDTVS